jgi:hypothetical protein
MTPEHIIVHGRTGLSKLIIAAASPSVFRDTRDPAIGITG